MCSVTQLCLTLWSSWTVALQAPLSMRFSRLRTLERVAISFPRGRISYIGKWTLYPITTWEALYKDISKLD